MTNRNDNAFIMTLNGAGVVVAYALLGVSLYLSTDAHWRPRGTGVWGLFC